VSCAIVIALAIGCSSAGPTGGAGGGPAGGAHGGFTISGKLDTSSGAIKPQDQPLGGTHTGTSTITHVVAVTPSSQNTQRIVTNVDPTGSFSIDLDPSRLWVLVFVDATKKGSDMIAGVFKAEGLHTVAPMQKGHADLGKVTLQGGEAHASMPYADLLAALGLDPSSALFLSSIDDMCLRVVNPDVDANGTIDVLEDKDFRLDFHVQFALRSSGQAVTTDDLVGKFLPDDVAIDYGGTGIYVSLKRSLVSAEWKSGIWASFDEPLVYSPVSTSGPPGAPKTCDVGASVPAPDMITMGYGDYASFGVYAQRGFDMPQGDYRFGVDANTLTFTDVKTRTDAELQGADNFIMPFVKLVKKDATCTSECNLSGIDYVWRKRTATGWVPATDAEVALVAGDQGGYVSVLLDNQPTKNVGWTVPKTPATGSVAWESANSPDPSVLAALATATTRDICHFGLSYDDKLGMRYFGSIQDVAGNCK
jgi:hypothetical protein